jgi:hypothetical protein
MVWTRLALAAALALAAGGQTLGSTARHGVTDADLRQVPDAEWLNHGRDYGEQRFSPLTGITDANVGELGLAWYADFDTARGQEATPLVRDGVLYLTTAWSKVRAYDALNGALRWAYDPEVPRETLVRTLRCGQPRGRALWRQGLCRRARRPSDRARPRNRQGRLVQDRRSQPEGLHDHRRPAGRQRQGVHRQRRRRIPGARLYRRVR